MTDTAKSSLSNNAAISKSFVEARLAGRSLSRFPGGVLPASMEAAYDIQSKSISLWPDEVKGWKVGGIPPHLQASLGSERLAGPIFSNSTFKARPSGNVMHICNGGFAAVEAEFVIKTAVDIRPNQMDVSLATIGELIDNVYIGAEIAGSPLSTINEIGPLCVVSDFGNNAGLVVGEALKDWRSADFSEIGISVHVDGECVGQVLPGKSPANPIQAFLFLIKLCADRDITLKAGTLVSTGAITGIHEVGIGMSSRVEFQGCDVLSIDFAEVTQRSSGQKNIVAEMKLEDVLNG